MGLWQRVSRSRGIPRQSSILRKLLNRDDLPAVELIRAVEAAELVWRNAPDQFGLTLLLGQGCAAIATREPWERRESWLERAVVYFERALTLADAGRLAGADEIAEAGPSAWPPDLGPGERAQLAAAFHAGVLRAGEFRVRNPARAIEHLRRVVDRLSGYHPAWYYLGEAHVLAGQFDEAERAWREGLARAPDDALLRQVLQNLPADRTRHRAKTGDWAGVLEALRSLPDGAMPACDLLVLEGDAYHTLGDEIMAREKWMAALERDHHAVGVRSRLRKLDRDLYGQSAHPRETRTPSP
jgi:tetratricopeptide (TPR) repeat protein